MKKSMIALAVALLVLNTLGVFAAVTPYMQPGSLTPASSVAYTRITALPRAEKYCNLDITTNRADVYFLGNARKECMEKNKYNLVCMQQCFEQVKLMARQTTIGRSPGAYSRTTCADLAPGALAGSTASRCYFDASVECAKINFGNDYCRKKCVEKSYAMCRQNVYAGKVR